MEVSITNPSTGQFLEIDVWIPSLSLGFEFQDLHHFVTTWYSNNTTVTTQSIDNIKAEHVRTRGITLIHIPCWWDSANESLETLIKWTRPDIDITSAADDVIIPLNPSRNFIPDSFVPDVGEVMLASFATPALISNITWWIGEKYDGIRAVWHPDNRSWYSRKGQVLHTIPLSFLSYNPVSSFLDGEIWLGRDLYMMTQSIYSNHSIAWDLLRVVAFDNPSLAVSQTPFELRYESFLLSLPLHHPFIVPAMRLKFQKRENSATSSQLQIITGLQEQVLDQGGEGLVMRAPLSLYHQGRSTQLLKLKAGSDDSEALVVSVTSNALNDKSYLLQLPSGSFFRVTHNNFFSSYLSNTDNSPTITLTEGDIITFDFENFSRIDVPVNPSFIRFRRDLDWPQVVNDFIRNPPRPSSSPGVKPKGYWTAEEHANMRHMLEDFARNRNLDPLSADTWYSILRKFIVNQNSISLSFFQKQGGYIKTLVSLFPDINFDLKQFPSLPSGYLSKIQKRREIFDNFATEHGFNPLIPENWYSIPRELLIDYPGTASVVYYYGGYKKALVHVYPEIDLNPQKFLNTTVNLDEYWDQKKNRRKFFDSIARDYGFDPLVSSNWLQVSKRIILARKDARAVLRYYNRNVVKALQLVYPKLDWSADIIRKLEGKESQWETLTQQKEFFDNIAKSLAFDPLEASRWARVPQALILSQKGAGSILKRHQGSINRALAHIYPNRASSVQIHKTFFDTLAKENGIDPLVPDNWYTILAKHNNNTSKLNTNELLRAYPNIGLDITKMALPSGYWNDASRRKMFFDTFAASHLFDPLVANNWYSFSSKDFLDQKSGKAVLKYYGGSFIKALTCLYPDIGLEINKFNIVPSGHWVNQTNRLEFFNTFAKEKGFDPRIASNWYSAPRKEILARKGAKSLLYYYNGSVIKALFDLYHDIGLDLKSFGLKTPNQWEEKSKRKELFLLVAEKYGFDALSPENWYTLPLSDLFSVQGTNAVVHKYNGSVANALLDCFPDIGLEKSKFRHVS